jgi:putative chitinase
MCISGSVGALAQNRRDDVKTVQIMLNFGRPSPFRPLDTDGAIGKATIDAIHEYQTRVVKANSPDARVDPGGDTLRSLRLGIPQDRFYWGHLQGVALQASTARVDRYYPALARHMGTYGIDTPLRRAHFLAQVCHESGQLNYTEEIATGDAYEGRADLGNDQPGDGRRFKGRGLIQLTGRANYAAFGRAIGRNFTTDVEARLLATDPDLACHVACWFWSGRALNALADADDITRVTRRINGGLNGLADRQALYARARCMFNLA